MPPLVLWMKCKGCSCALRFRDEIQPKLCWCLGHCFSTVVTLQWDWRLKRMFLAASSSSRTFWCVCMHPRDGGTPGSAPVRCPSIKKSCLQRSIETCSVAIWAKHHCWDMHQQYVVSPAGAAGESTAQQQVHGHIQHKAQQQH